MVTDVSGNELRIGDRIQIPPRPDCAEPKGVVVSLKRDQNLIGVIIGDEMDFRPSSIIKVASVMPDAQPSQCPMCGDYSPKPLQAEQSVYALPIDQTITLLATDPNGKTLTLKHYGEGDYLQIIALPHGSIHVHKDLIGDLVATLETLKVLPNGLTAEGNAEEVADLESAYNSPAPEKAIL